MKEAGLRPSTYCMNSLMAVSVNARQPNTALEIFKEMERDGIPRDVVSLETSQVVFFPRGFSESRRRHVCMLSCQGFQTPSNSTVDIHFSTKYLVLV